MGTISLKYYNTRIKHIAGEAFTKPYNKNADEYEQSPSVGQIPWAFRIKPEGRYIIRNRYHYEALLQPSAKSSAFKHLDFNHKFHHSCENFLAN